MSTPTKVLLVEDSPVAMEILQRLLKSSPDVEIIATARKEALELLPNIEPNVICTDLNMTPINGLELTQQVMAIKPTPILVISDAVQQSDTNNIFDLLQAGAVDIFPKPASGDAQEYEQVKNRLLTKIKVLSGVSVFTKPLPKAANATSTFVSGATDIASIAATSSIRIVGIGASTGGPQALHKVISGIPANFPLPIICTQHISEGFLAGLVSWLDADCQLKVKIAEMGEKPVAGTVYFAPEKNHLELDATGKFICTTKSTVDGHVPSVTVMFQSLANYYGKAAAGILLTGMGKDGAEGMAAISKAGGMTIAQDEKSCIVFGMPKEAIALGAVQHTLSLSEIAPFVTNKVIGH
jgi:two-component system, chemotaxis family, protein-glutamate methylesterase/glutaminase